MCVEGEGLTHQYRHPLSAHSVLYVPALQFVHDAARKVENLPGPHTEQFTASPREYVPWSHGSQAVASLSLSVSKPAPHFKHASS